MFNLKDKSVTHIAFSSTNEVFHIIIKTKEGVVVRISDDRQLSNYNINYVIDVLSDRDNSWNDVVQCFKDYFNENNVLILINGDEEAV